MKKYTGYEYIKIDLANTFGLDKLTFDKRIAWTDKHIDELPLKAKEAESPILFAKAMKALEDAKNGIATGYIMSLDATASGLQVLACFMGCYETAKNVNLVDTGNREDIYTKVAKFMSGILGFIIERGTVKRPVMTTFYGSMQQPKRIFGAETPELAAFYEVLGDELPGAMEAMQDMQSFWNPTTLKHEFTLPDGHVASIKVMESIKKKIEVDELDHATFTHVAYINKESDKGLSLAANITHAVDGYCVREMQRRAHRQGFEMLTIHDSFWASPNHMQKVRENYANILADIADMDLLSQILSELSGSPVEVLRSSTDLGDLIRESEYALS